MSQIEIDLADRTVVLNEQILRRAQAVWRGALVRKNLMQVREEYERIVQEIEGPEAALQLTWQPDLFSPPKITKSSKPGLSVIRPEKPVPIARQPIQRKTSAKSISPRDPPTKDPLKDSTQNSSVKNLDQIGSSQKETQATSKNGENVEQSENVSSTLSHLSEVHTEESLSQDTENNRTDISTPTGNLGAKELPSLHPNTELWDTMDIESSRVQNDGNANPNVDRESLLKERGEISMELLWIQQAIESRKQYLRLRQEMASMTTQ